MPILLEVLQGESKGQFFRVEANRTLGRSHADILIPDVNISGTHAKIDFDNKGQFILIDLDSSNGLILNQKRVKKVALMPGVKFQVGKTQFVVRDVSEHEADSLAPVLGWKDQIKSYFTKKPVPEIQTELKPFEHLLELEFLRGVQAQEFLQLGFGPRLIGSSTWDIELKDLEIPEQAFELIPDEKNILLKNLSDTKLTVNKKNVDTQILESGDTIEVGSTIIRVHIKQGNYGHS